MNTGANVPSRPSHALQRALTCGCLEDDPPDLWEKLLSPGHPWSGLFRPRCGEVVCAAPTHTHRAKGLQTPPWRPHGGPCFCGSTARPITLAFRCLETLSGWRNSSSPGLGWGFFRTQGESNEVLDYCFHYVWRRDAHRARAGRSAVFGSAAGCLRRRCPAAVQLIHGGPSAAQRLHEPQRKQGQRWLQSGDGRRRKEKEARLIGLPLLSPAWSGLFLCPQLR
jgi:hypothetical protein